MTIDELCDDIMCGEVGPDILCRKARKMFAALAEAERDAARMRVALAELVACNQARSPKDAARVINAWAAARAALNPGTGEAGR